MNAVEMLAARSMQGVGAPAARQVQVRNGDVFGPECEVNISREGRKLSRQQTTQAEKNVQSTQNIAAESNQPCQQEGMKGLRENLMEMFQEIGLSGQNLLDRVDEVYGKMCRPSHGDLQFSLNEPSEEAMAAVKELAQKAVKVENVVSDPSGARDLIQEAKAAGTYQEYKV